MARVLIVDDEESIRVTLAEFIKEDRYAIAIAEDAAEALRLMDKHAFDVIVTDIILPRMNGVALMKKIRERSPDTQVIMLTGDPTVETATEAVRAGAFDYLTKPVSKNAIRQVVASAATVKLLIDEKHKLEESNRWYKHHLEELVEKRTAALTASEKRYRTLFSNIADPIFIFDQETGRFLGCNQSVLDRYGYTMGELQAMTPQRLHPSEEVERATANIEEEEDLSLHRYTHVTKGGEQFPVEVHTTALEYQGKNAWISIARDITKRMQAENALRESESRYRGIVQYQTEGITRWLPDGTLTFVNDAYCSYYGKSRDELIGADWMETVAQADHEEMLAYAERLRNMVMQGNPVLTTEHREVATDGEIRWVQWSDHAIFDEKGNLVEFQGSGRDITERKRAQEKERRLLQQQIAMNELSLALGNYVSLQEIYDTIYRYVAKLIETDALYISSYNKNEQLIKAEYVRDEYGHEIDPATLPPLKLESPGHGTQSQVIRSGKPMYIPDILEAMDKIEESYDIARDGTVTRDTVPYSEQEDVPRSELLAPMLFRGEAIGAIVVESLRVDAYTQSNLDLLSGLANVAAVAIENAHLQEGLKKTLEDTIRVVGLTTEMRDPYTARHQERMTQLACAIARKMRIPEQQIEGIHAAGLLHDIGKIAVPAEILTKPTKLTDVEFALIKTHPQVAYDILKGIEFPWPLADIVLQHHERLDGSGYPNGLKGDEILLEARILAVADVVEAISSHRPYRPALGVDAALDEIKKGKGRLYNPAAVGACLALFEKGFSFE